MISEFRFPASIAEYEPGCDEAEARACAKALRRYGDMSLEDALSEGSFPLLLGVARWCEESVSELIPLASELLAESLRQFEASGNGAPAEAPKKALFLLLCTAKALLESRKREGAEKRKTAGEGELARALSRAHTFAGSADAGLSAEGKGLYLAALFDLLAPPFSPQLHEEVTPALVAFATSAPEVACEFCALAVQHVDKSDERESLGRVLAGVADHANGISTALAALDALLRKALALSETEQTRNMRAVLAEFARLRSRIVLQNLPLWSALRTSDSYQLRNVFAEAVTEAIVRLREEVETAPLANLLIERLFDKASFARSCVISCFSRLLGADVFDTTTLCLFCACALDRLHDTSSHVRKRALLYLQEFIFKGLLPARAAVAARLHGEPAEQPALQRLLELHDQLGQEMGYLHKLLYSKTQADVLETLRLFHILELCRFEADGRLLHAALPLVFSRDRPVKQELLRIFHKHFIAGAPPLEVIERLTRFYAESDAGGRLCVDEALGQLLQAEEDPRLQPAIKNELWEYVSAHALDPQHEPRAAAALHVLCVAVARQPLWLGARSRDVLALLQRLLAAGFAGFELLAELAALLAAAEPEGELADIYLKVMVFYLVKHQGCDDPLYLRLAQRVVHLAFALRENPEVVCDFLLKRLARQCTTRKPSKQGPRAGEVFKAEPIFELAFTQAAEPAAGDARPRSLVHLIHVAGQVAIHFMLLVEKIEAQLSRISQARRPAEAGQLEAALCAEEAEFEERKRALHRMVQKNLLETNSLRAFLPLLDRITEGALQAQAEAGGPVNDLLFSVALDCMAKFMLLSEDVCRLHVDRLAELAEREDVAVEIRSNLIIYLGDLFHKHPRHLAPHLPRVFQCLKSARPLLRHNALAVLSHLVLNDFYKAKGELADLAQLLTDTDAAVLQKARLFFREYALKDPEQLPTLFPDALGRLARTAELDTARLTAIVAALLEFVDERRLAGPLLETLLRKLDASSPRDCHAILIAMELLPLSEQSLSLLLEHAQSLRCAVEASPENKDIIAHIFAKLRKSPKLNRALIEQFEKQITENSAQVFEELRLRRAERPRHKSKRKL